MGRVLIVKVYTVVLCADFKNFVVCSVLKDHLFDEVKGFLVFDVLSGLNDGAPCVRGELFLTVVALHVEFCELSDEGLLYFCVVVELLFNCDFDFYSFGMALSPNESGIKDFCLVETFNLFQQQCQKLFTVSVAGYPWGSHVSVTESTEVDNSFLGDTDGYVSFGDSTCGAYGADGGDELNTAHGTQNGDVSWLFDLHLCCSKV